MHFVVYINIIAYFCYHIKHDKKKNRRNNYIMLNMEKIDKLDKKILSILSKNARIPFKDVAAECGVSRAAIHQRVQHLIEAGVITGSGFDINPLSLGYHTCTYIGINLEKGSHGSAQQQVADHTGGSIYRDADLARAKHQTRDSGQYRRLKNCCR